MSEVLQRYKSIILVDDDSDDRCLFAEAFSLIDPTINLILKRDGEELVEYLRNNPAPDVIFLDLNMPRKNGKECLIHLREDDSYKQIPVVIYTTSLNPKDIEETYKYGATYFLRKPNSFQELQEILNTTLRSTLPAKIEKSLDNFVIKGTLRLV